jgi:CubicO group peptidase (beta-lactamase class C family)
VPAVRPPPGHGLTSAGRERLHVVAERHVGEDKVPGLVVLVSSGDDIHVEALGSLTAGEHRPVQRDSLFRIASTSKPITAAATLTVIDDGLIGLDEAIDRLLPELADREVLKRMDGPLDDTVPAAGAITTRQLLTFTFGFGMAAGMFRARTPWPVVAAADELKLATIGPPDPAVQPDPDTWIANLGTLPLLAQPGERWLYNTGASVLGVLVARATGQRFADVLRTRLFEPLQMRDTSFWTAETDRLATAYMPTADGLVVADEAAGKWSRPPAFGDGAAGLLSTVDDLHAFARMLLAHGGETLSGQAVSQMTSDQLTDAQKAAGGLGRDFFKGRSWGYCQAVQDDGAYGWDGGFGSSWLVDPAHDLVVTVLTQRMFESPEPPAVHRELRAAAYEALAST